MFEFKIKNSYKKARSGFFNTPHGKLETPNLAIVATHGKIKLLNKTEHLRANPDLIIANTFHLFVNNKVKEIKGSGGLHQWSSFQKPIMTDSGGFQVFSLGWGKIHGIGKVLEQKNFFSLNPLRSPQRGELTCSPACAEASAGRSARSSIFGGHRARSPAQVSDKRNFSVPEKLVKISEDGVIFDFNGKNFELTPEKSIKIQKDLGADIIFTFDECTSPFNSYAYTKKAMERTHRWAIRCLNFFHSHSHGHSQSLFGIVQGGIFEDLRKKSSKFIGSLAFNGFGIGGSFSEKQMRKVLNWSLSGLAEDKPRHLLGIGKIKDIFIAVKQGIDLFDCVVPTREARHAVLYTKAGKLNIEKEIFVKDKKMIEKNCQCWVCRQEISRQEIRHYFKTERIYGQRLATLHNIYFFKNLFREIREAIIDKRLEKLEEEYYNYR